MVAQNLLELTEMTKSDIQQGVWEALFHMGWCLGSLSWQLLYLHIGGNVLVPKYQIFF